MSKYYKVPTGKLPLFIYNWREWGFKLAWSMLTNPKAWEPVLATLEETTMYLSQRDFEQLNDAINGEN